MFPKELESEAIFIMREVAAQFDNPVLLFSGGKDSITLMRLAQKAFYPNKIPFTIMHVDTGHNFPETVEFRDRLMKELDANLIVKYVQDSIDQNKAVEETGKYASRNALQTVTLNAAKIAGIDETSGTIEVGKDANIVISEGDMLDIRSNKIIYSFISGRTLNLDNKHKRLYRKFSDKYGHEIVE